ncbi:hypothetical protein [Streptomyces chartreusis]|uniref:Uncharacterized protein n=1 Tax=Streptomyces chartreusis TaxID=1969 RepID=A0A7H8TIW3_STRCX|nr:hypothetical protein [Streptomyces chartreusis]QKZ23274.1 hypothetical protein HUT05_41490 [Streptomyces chartreusis]
MSKAPFSKCNLVSRHLVTSSLEERFRPAILSTVGQLVLEATAARMAWCLRGTMVQEVAAGSRGRGSGPDTAHGRRNPGGLTALIIASGLNVAPTRLFENVFEVRDETKVEY